jgi:hypothetical protein
MPQSRPRFVSAIPDNHPYKAEIEDACLRLLDEWGPGWRIGISANARSAWAMHLRRDGSSGQQRYREFSEQAFKAANVERWLRETIAEIRAASNPVFGMMPMGKLSDEPLFKLVDLVGLFGGRLHPDGWITLADEKAWPAFLKRVEEVGVKLVASVR